MKTLFPVELAVMRVPQAREPLNVVVVGAGVGGLTTAKSLAIRGHKVLILEASPKLFEVGAGIQVAPNMRKMLERLGLGHVIRDKGVVLEKIQVFRWQDGRILFDGPVDNRYGDCAVIHRADLHRALVEDVLRMGNVELRLNSTVIDIALDEPAVTLWTGEVIYGDVVVAADGVKSLARRKMLPEAADKSRPTGDAAFRILVPRELMIQDPDLRGLIDEQKVVRWVGPNRHIVGYPIRKHQLYNLVLVHPDGHEIGESWTTPGSKQEMIDTYCGWEPRVQKLIRIVSEADVLKSRLCAHPPLKTWVKGRCTLLGDACHPMLPYVAQGAAQAVEDAVALGVILSGVPSTSEIPLALRAYEKSRKIRAEMVQQSGTDNRLSLHLPDGPDQVARDEQFRASMMGGNNPDIWSDRGSQSFLWGWDAEEDARLCWADTLAVPRDQKGTGKRL